ncbi:hypothetical protein GOV10_01195 [Candidatus Woesearchaeota archaeon]|nr:hypothetical protein [Candidatus Woesearchaeota archaeon]
MADYEEIRKRYVEKLDSELSNTSQKLQSSRYELFRKQYLPKKFSLYERACNFAEKVLAVSPDKKKEKPLAEAIAAIHLQITPKGAASLALLLPVIIIFLSLLFFFILPSLLGGAPMIFFIAFFVIVALAILIPLGNLPITLANKWRMQAGNQMVLCIFYIVTYMRHTSNLELAINFAGDHLSAPLSLDMKKVLWNVETEKYESIRESLDDYLQSWKSTNMEFIESMHLIMGSLLENSESRRVEILEKSLSVMLDETYEKMLHYAHDLKSPLTTLHMLGIILPILGLVILPLVVSFMENVHWYHLFMLYNVALPIGVFFLGKGMLSKRPSGYGAVDITDLNPDLKKLKGVVVPLGQGDSFTISPLLFAIFVFGVLFIVGFVPLFYPAFNPGTDIILAKDYTIKTIDYTNKDDISDTLYYFYGYREIIENEEPTGEYFGPFGLGATLISLLIPLAFGLGVGLYYRLRSGNVVKLRRETKQLEQEFASGLFQLGNRLADGLPAEIAFSKVAAVLDDTATGRFFDIVSANIIKLGHSVEQAIFDEKTGALRNYPSSIIESSMKVLVESSKKGPLIASQAVINVSEYIKQMHRVDERLKDLMADVISSMKSQVNFLTPVIAGIVIGITSMITKILGTLTNTIAGMSDLQGGASVQGAQMLSMFGSGGVPTYFFQIIVGLYVVQLAYILTILVNGIENGVDKLAEEEMLGKNMVNSTLLYCVMALVIIIIFNVVAGTMLAGSFS